MSAPCENLGHPSLFDGSTTNHDHPSPPRSSQGFAQATAWNSTGPNGAYPCFRKMQMPKGTPRTSVHQNLRSSADVRTRSQALQSLVMDVLEQTTEAFSRKLWLGGTSVVKFACIPWAGPGRLSKQKPMETATTLNQIHNPKQYTPNSKFLNSREPGGGIW